MECVIFTPTRCVCVFRHGSSDFSKRPLPYTIWDNYRGANSFKLTSAANWTQDCSSTSSLTDWAIITLATQAYGSFFDRDRWSRLHTYVHTWETKATPSIQGVRYWCCPWKCMLVDMLVSIFFTWTMTVCPSYTCPGWVQESALHTHTHDCIND